ncbi:hypothetical protein [Acinetobacter baumannii]|uniref:hypothetical protein n=1 Tax=Acinetobacter baumannii TaxID=470 RepID=UPI003892524D
MDKPNKELLQAFIDWFMREYSNFGGKPISERYDEAFDTFNNDFIDARYDAFQDGWKAQQAKVEELKASHHGEVIGHEVHFKKIKQERDELQTLYTQQGINMLKLQKRVDELERKLQIKTRHCEFYEQSRKGHRSLAIHRKKQINSALEQIEKLYSKAEYDYEKDRNPYYDGMLSALDLAEQAIRGELEEQALKGEGL